MSNSSNRQLRSMKILAGGIGAAGLIAGYYRKPFYFVLAWKLLLTEIKVPNA